MRFYKKMSLIYLSDEELNAKFAWKRKCFKDPFFGFEEELELREYRKLIDKYENKKREKQIEVHLTLEDFKQFDFSFFMKVKHKIYDAAVHRKLKKDVNEYKTPFLTKKALVDWHECRLFIQMYIEAFKREQRLIDIEDFEFRTKGIQKENSLLKKYSPISTMIEELFEDDEEDDEDDEISAESWSLFKQNLKEQLLQNRKASFNSEEDRSIWTLNKRILSNIKQDLLKSSGEIISLLFEDQATASSRKDTEEMIFWSEDNIPYFFINQKTGVLNYDFWNNTEERVERRNAVVKLWKEGKKTWEDVKAENIYIPTLAIRGLFGFHDLVLLRQTSFLRKSKNRFYLPYFSKIYNLFNNPEKALDYPKIMYGLIGSTLIPHWCLIFTITKKRKNIYFTVTDMAGKVLLTVSAGKFNIHRRKRFSPHALEPLYQQVLNCFRKLKIKNVILVLKFKAKYMHLHTFNFFRKNRIAVKLVIDKLPVPHNGIRARKQKRL